jgi:hypothetical protein
MKRSLVMLVAAVATVLLAGTNVRADNIPWGYSSTDTEIFNNNNPITSSSVKFTGSSGVASGASGIIIYNLSATSTAGDASPDSFSNVPFNLAVTFTDIKATGSASGGAKASDSVNFAGLFNASNVTKSSLLPGVTTWTSPTTAELILGADDVGWRKYTVTINSFTPPGQPGGAPGSIQAIVNIESTDGPGGSGEGPPTAPEPASMLLAALGLPLVYLVRRRMKKNQAEATIA